MIVPGGADPVAAAAEGKATVLFAPAHAVEGDVPLENLLAFIESAGRKNSAAFAK